MRLEPVQLVMTETVKAAVIRLQAHPRELPSVMGPAFPELMAEVAAQGLQMTGPVFSHFFRMSPELFEFEIGVPVAGEVRKNGRIAPGELPAATVARTVYQGPYEGLPQAWGQFDELVKSAGHEKQAELWEAYLYGPESSPDPSTWKTELNRLVQLPG